MSLVSWETSAKLSRRAKSRRRVRGRFAEEPTKTPEDKMNAQAARVVSEKVLASVAERSLAEQHFAYSFKPQPDVQALTRLLDKAQSEVKQAGGLRQVARSLNRENVKYPAFHLYTLDEAVAGYARREPPVKVTAFADAAGWLKHGRQVNREEHEKRGVTVNVAPESEQPDYVRLYDFSDTVALSDDSQRTHEAMSFNSEDDRFIEDCAIRAIQQAGVRLEHSVANPQQSGHGYEPANALGHYLGHDQTKPTIVTVAGQQSASHAAILFHELSHHFDLTDEYKLGNREPAQVKANSFEDEHVAVLAAMSVAYEFGLDVADQTALELLIVRERFGRNNHEQNLDRSVSDVLAERPDIVERWQKAHHAIVGTLRQVDLKSALQEIKHGTVL